MGNKGSQRPPMREIRKARLGESNPGALAVPGADRRAAAPPRHRAAGWCNIAGCNSSHRRSTNWKSASLNHNYVSQHEASSVFMSGFG